MGAFSWLSSMTISPLLVFMLTYTNCSLAVVVGFSAAGFSVVAGSLGCSFGGSFAGSLAGALVGSVFGGSFAGSAGCARTGAAASERARTPAPSHADARIRGVFIVRCSFVSTGEMRGDARRDRSGPVHAMRWR